MPTPPTWDHGLDRVDVADPQQGPWPGRRSSGPRTSCMAVPIAWPTYAAHDREPGGLGHRLDGVADVGRCGCRRPSGRCRRRALLGDLDRLAPPRSPGPPGAVKAASPCQPWMMAPQSMEMMSPSSEPVGPGMPWTIMSFGDEQMTPPGSRGSRGSSAGAAALDDPRGRSCRARGVVIPGGWPRGCTSCIGDAARPAHDGDLVRACGARGGPPHCWRSVAGIRVIGAIRRRRRWPWSRGRRPRRSPHAVDRDQYARGRRRSTPRAAPSAPCVEVEAAADDLLGVVGAATQQHALEHAGSSGASMLTTAVGGRWRRAPRPGPRCGKPSSR